MIYLWSTCICSRTHILTLHVAFGVIITANVLADGVPLFAQELLMKRCRLYFDNDHDSELR